jgi:3-hydroxymyristoyl/3-hydroxydecanoyl-(acyl carrier protein) dehydratase
MIDGMLACVPHEQVMAFKTVTDADPLARGDPADEGRLWLPAALVLEGLNQTSALLFRLSYGKLDRTRLPLLGHLRARIGGGAALGDRIVYAVRSLKMTATHGLFAGSAAVGGRRIAEAEMGFAMATLPAADEPPGGGLG